MARSAPLDPCGVRSFTFTAPGAVNMDGISADSRAYTYGWRQELRAVGPGWWPVIHSVAWWTSAVLSFPLRVAAGFSPRGQTTFVPGGTVPPPFIMITNGFIPPFFPPFSLPNITTRFADGFVIPDYSGEPMDLRFETVKFSDVDITAHVTWSWHRTHTDGV